MAANLHGRAVYCKVLTSGEEARHRLLLLASHQSVQKPRATACRRLHSETKGTRWADLGSRRLQEPLVANRESAARSHFRGRRTVAETGAPKGIRNRTCGSQPDSACPDGCGIVAGHSWCSVSRCPAPHRAAAGGRRASSSYKAREWHNEPRWLVASRGAALFSRPSPDNA